MFNNPITTSTPIIQFLCLHAEALCYYSVSENILEINILMLFTVSLKFLRAILLAMPLSPAFKASSWNWSPHSFTSISYPVSSTPLGSRQRSLNHLYFIKCLIDYRRKPILCFPNISAEYQNLVPNKLQQTIF